MDPRLKHSGMTNGVGDSEYMNGISRLTLGTAQIGLDYGIANKAGKVGRAQAFDILRSAMASGIDSFDTSQAYGESESVIGSFIAGNPDAGYAPLIISKLPRVKAEAGAGPIDIFCIVRDMLQTSLSRLCVRKVPVYLMHDACDMTSYGGSVVAALVKMREEGLIGKLGVSVYHPDEARRALNIKEIEVIELPVNLFDHRFVRTGLVKDLAAAGKTVLARSVYLQGLFFLKGKELSAGMGQASPYLDKLNELAANMNTEIDELAMAFVNGIPGVASIVVGAESVPQVKRNAELAAKSGMDDGTRGKIMGLFRDVPEKTVLPYLWDTKK